MAMVTVDDKGRVMIPKKVREELDVQPGDALFLQRDGSTLHLVKVAPPMMEKVPSADQSTDDGMLSDAPAVNVQPGMRVELTGTPTAVTLRGRRGTVVREDEDEDYVIVALDTPALYRHMNGEVEELPEIVVMIDNLRAIGL